MANLTLITDPDDMRVIANAVESLIQEFQKQVKEMTAFIELRLMSQDCKGPTANAFKESFNRTVVPAFEKEIERLEAIVNTLRQSATGFDGAVDSTVSTINSKL